MAVTKHGKLDIMMNNAGILTKKGRLSILDDEKAEFEHVLAVNVTGVFLGTKHAARAMIPACQGSIISTASMCSIMGGIASHSYTASKHAVEGLMKNTAVELGQHGIRVNCVSPYVVDTPLAKNFFGFDDKNIGSYFSNLVGRVLKAQDIAEAALYLASDESNVSGHNLVVDGGFTTGNSFFKRV
ncbi:hypothetical protein Scep_015125 [Stephania cephalantha]|uniref:Secoisolariciresinol dehydrogenase n=1 Tax=Stephania cephalantha TaxID=152367 RepID=A0AAP0P159_9MAGN